MRRGLGLAVVAAAVAGYGCSQSPGQQSCNDACQQAGATRCGAAQIETCLAGPNGCLAWGAPMHCPGEQVCDGSSEKCIEPSCIAAPCSVEGASKCSGVEIQTCETLGSGCRAWSLPKTCDDGQECDAAQGRCVACTADCPSEGATQCAGDQVQACSGSGRCLKWGPATSCPAGQTCDPSQSACVDVCTTPAVTSACAAAAAKSNDCCGGTLPPFSAEALCHGFLAATPAEDPIAGCMAESAKSCDTAHSDWLAAGECCCPTGKACEPIHMNCTTYPPCQAQSDCGDIVVELNTNICLHGLCRPPGPICTGRAAPAPGCQKLGDPLPAEVDYEVTFNSPFGDGGEASEPQSLVVRYFMAQAIDGTTLDCDKIAALAGDGSSYDPTALDQNPNLNLTYRLLYALAWGPGRTFVFQDSLVTQAKDVIFYAEAWYGTKAGGQMIPSGRRAASYCATRNGQTTLFDLTAAGPISMKFSFTPSSP